MSSLLKRGVAVVAFVLSLFVPQSSHALRHTPENYPLRVRFISVTQDHPGGMSADAGFGGISCCQWRTSFGLVDLKDGDQLSGASFRMICGDGDIPSMPSGTLIFSARWLKPGQQLEVVMDPYLGTPKPHGSWTGATCRVTVHASTNLWDTVNGSVVSLAPAAYTQTEARQHPTLAVWSSPPAPRRSKPASPRLNLVCDPSGAVAGGGPQLGFFPGVVPSSQTPCSLR